MLLTTVEARGEATSDSDQRLRQASFTYDGLGRLLTTTAWVSGTETARLLQTNSYDDANRRTVSTFTNGLIRTQTYNRSGDLISIANAGPAALGTTTYTYDADGRLRVVTDATGVKSYCFYDDAGRKIGEVDGDGSLDRVHLQPRDQLIKTVSYATRLGSATLSVALGRHRLEHDPFATLRTEANATPAANQITRNVYDTSGALVYTIDRARRASRRTSTTARADSRIRCAFSIPRPSPPVPTKCLPSAITVAANAADRRTRFFYNGDGKLTGTLDGAGYLRENVYDAAGRLITTIGYHNASDSSRWLTGTLDTLRPGSTGSTAQLDAARDITTRFFHDAQGRRVGELDGERYLTETVYDVAGNVSQTIRYDVALTFTPGTSTFATLRACGFQRPDAHALLIPTTALARS